MQDHYNLIYREEEREMIPQCIDQGVGVIPWSPLARGLLTGNRTRSGEKLTKRAQTDAFADSLYKPELDFEVVERADEVGAERGVPTAQVALAWLLHRPGVTAPIVGATKLEHLEDALAAEQLSLSQEEIKRLEELYQPHPVAGHQEVAPVRVASLACPPPAPTGVPATESSWSSARPAISPGASSSRASFTCTERG